MSSAFQLVTCLETSIQISVTGKFCKLSEETEEFGVIVERLKLYFIENSVKDDTKVPPMFLTVVGSKNYSILRNLISSDKPPNKKFYLIWLRYLQSHNASKKSINVLVS